MHQDRKPTVPGIVQKPKKSMSHKEQSPREESPCQLTTAKGLTLARVCTPFPPTGAAGGAAARAFPWGLSPSWQVTISAHLDSILVPSCSEGLRAPHCCPQVSRSNTQVQHSGTFSPPPPTCYSSFLSTSHRCTPCTVATLFSAPQPCEHLSTELHPPEQPVPILNSSSLVKTQPSVVTPAKELSPPRKPTPHRIPAVDLSAHPPPASLLRGVLNRAPCSSLHLILTRVCGQ